MIINRFDDAVDFVIGLMLCILVALLIVVVAAGLADYLTSKPAVRTVCVESGCYDCRLRR